MAGDIGSLSGLACLHDIVFAEPAALPLRAGRPGTRPALLSLGLNAKGLLQVRLGSQLQLRAMVGPPAEAAQQPPVAAAVESAPTPAARALLVRIVRAQAGLAAPAPQAMLAELPLAMAWDAGHEGVRTDGYTGSHQPQVGS